MDKHEVEKLLPKAYQAVGKESGVSVIKRSDFSAFGATLIMSGLYPAIAAYSKDMNIYCLDMISEVTGRNLSDELRQYCQTGKGMTDEDTLKEEIVNAVIAIKLVLDTEDKG